MMKHKLSLITMVLLCVISTISSRLKELEVVRKKNTESTAAAILGSNPNQSQNEEDQQNESKNHLEVTLKPGALRLRADWKTGTDVRILDGCTEPLQQLGKENYWKIVFVDGEPYTESLMEKKIKGKVPYQLTFLKNSEKTWSIGEKVQLHGLQKYTQYNGFTGVIQQDLPKGRWAVKLQIEDQNKLFTVKSENLKKLIIVQENLTPQYSGVSWDENYKKWKTELIHKGMKYSGGVFADEEHAAMKINLLCDKYEVERKNPTIDIKLFEAPQVQENLTSQYIGVSWDINYKKWQAQLMHKEKKYSGGVFNNEEHAAMKVNLLCDKYEVERKNPTIDIELFEAPRVIYSLRTKLQAQLLTNKEKQHHVGSFDNEKDAAAESVNLLREYEVERKNPKIDKKLSEAHQVKKHSDSQYIGVSWDKKNKQWKTQLKHKEKKYSGGFFDYEEHAAMKANLLCDEFGIQRKNPMIDIELDDIRQPKRKFKIYRPGKAENIAKNDKVKVKEENLFDKCDNNFIKKSYQSQKRKRKEDVISNDDVIEKPNTIPNHVENKFFEEIQKNYIKILD